MLQSLYEIKQLEQGQCEIGVLEGIERCRDGEMTPTFRVNRPEWAC